MIEKRRSINSNQLILNIVLSIISILIIVPFVLLVSVSFSSEADVSKYGYLIFPKQIDLSAYKFLWKNSASLLQAYKITALYSIIGTLLSVLLMAMLAYPLSKPNYKFRTPLNYFLFFPMLFSGGLVPTYILITRYLCLTDSIWVYILPTMINVWYVFMMRTFFSGIPQEIYESAYIDGASEYRCFISMTLPMSTPVLATVGLFVFLTKWNEWFTSMLYINNTSLVSLQYLLQRIMLNIQVLNEGGGQMGRFTADVDVPTETVRMAMAVAVAGPALVVFPFFQKYFVKGLTVGGVKG